MKSYLCIEYDKEVVKSDIKNATQRAAIYFILKANNWKEAGTKAKEMGANVVRVLTKSEAATEAKDGSYDIEL